MLVGHWKTVREALVFMSIMANGALLLQSNLNMVELVKPDYAAPTFVAFSTV